MTAVFSDAKTLAEYVDWLRFGHTAAVIAGGAESGVIVRIIEPGSPLTVEAHYTFKDRDAFERYVRVAAPALRADGLRLFGDRGIEFRRSVGELVEAE